MTDTYVRDTSQDPMLEAPDIALQAATSLDAVEEEKQEEQDEEVKQEEETTPPSEEL